METEKIQNTGIVLLASDLTEIKKGVEAFTKVKTDLLTDHTIDIKGKKYIKKSGWRIVALAFNLSDRIVSKEYKELGNGEYVVTYTVEVAAPNGRTAQGIGTCSTLEKAASKDSKYHHTETHAHTRAKNRAIADLVGLGEITAEEMLEDSTADETISVNFCKDQTHNHTTDEQKNNRCIKTGKMLRMP